MVTLLTRNQTTVQKHNIKTVSANSTCLMTFSGNILKIRQNNEKYLGTCIGSHLVHLIKWQKRDDKHPTINKRKISGIF